MSRVCPLGLGACALVNEVPGAEVGDFAVTGGSGGSVTSSSVKTGFGAWAGGMAFTRFKKSPGGTGDMYCGGIVSFVPKHRFLLYLAAVKGNSVMVPLIPAPRIYEFISTVGSEKKSYG